MSDLPNLPTLGDRVFDRATQQWATIVHIEPLHDETDLAIDDTLDPTKLVYTLDPSIPDDPDFPHRQRILHEIAPTEDTTPLPRAWSLTDDGFKPATSH